MHINRIYVNIFVYVFIVYKVATLNLYCEILFICVLYTENTS